MPKTVERKIEKLCFSFKQDMAKPEVLEIRLYGEVGYLKYDWENHCHKSENTQDTFVAKLDEYKDVKQINLYINSNGGDVEEGYGIYANLKRHPANKTCYVDGFANSIASVIAMACDKIVMYSNSMMGIHNVMTWAGGNANDHRKVADMLDQIMEGNRKIYLEHSGGKITLEKLTELLDAETWLTAEQCLEYGFCDEIDTAHQADDSKIEESMSRVVENMRANLAELRSIRQQLNDLETTPTPPPTEQEPPTPATSLSAEKLAECMINTFH